MPAADSHKKTAAPLEKGPDQGDLLAIPGEIRGMYIAIIASVESIMHIGSPKGHQHIGGIAHLRAKVIGVDFGEPGSSRHRIDHSSPAPAPDRICKRGQALRLGKVIVP